MAVRQRFTNLVCTAIVQLDGKGQGQRTAELFAKLPDGCPLPGTGIENGEGLSLWRTQVRGHVRDGPFVGRVKPAAHLRC